MDHLHIVLAAAGIAALAVYGAGKVGRRLGVVSMVKGDRWHRHGVIPRLSGPALLLALFPWLSAGQFLVLGAFCAAGTLDDIVQLTPARKSVLLLVPCAAGAWLGGSWWLLPVYWVVVNAVNLLDHADGLAGAAVAGSLALAGSHGALAGVGACLGFLVFNYPPARVFLGDGGSMLLGALLVASWSPSGPVPLALGVAVPVADMAFVTARRLLEHRKPWVGGTDHTGHVLLRAGVPPRLLPLLYAAAAALLTLAGTRL